MKRLRNGQMIETPVSLNNSTSSTESETYLKVSYDEVDQRHKVEPEPFSLLPYISESDINANGEARKDNSTSSTESETYLKVPYD